MRFLQIVFLIGFAVFVLVVPFLLIQVLVGNPSYLIFFAAVIFAVNAFFIIRKVSNLSGKR